MAPECKASYVRQSQSAPKHIHPSSAQSLLKAPFVPEAPRERPGWKGVGFTKSKKGEKLQTREKNALKAAAAAAAWVDPHGVFFELEEGVAQKVLDVCRTEFPGILDQEALGRELERVRLAVEGGKGEEAFESKEGREAYTVRWAPGTGMMLAALVGGWCEEELRDISVFKRLRGEGEEVKPLNVLAIGGGPAEVMAFAQLVRHAQPETVGSIEEGNRSEATPKLSLQLVDEADWSAEIDTLTTALVSPPKLSKYASAAAKAAAVPFLAKGALDVQFHKRDVLAPWSEVELAGLVGEEPAIITLVNTLPALQAQSVSRAIKFLMALTRAAPKNSLLLVADEPEAAVRAGEKRYPLGFLLELALLGKGVLDEEEGGESEGEEEGEMKAKRAEANWERLVGDELRNLTVDRALKYPLGLGVVAMQVHLFRRT